MPTRKYNPIGTGTRNFPLNAPVDWLLEVKRAACAAGVSAGEFLRELAELGAAQKNRDLAERLRRIRQDYYRPAIATAMLALFTVTVLADGHRTDLRLRACRRGRQEFGHIIEVEEET